MRWRRRQLPTRGVDDIIAALVVDENQTIIHANRLLCDLLAHSKGALEGQDLNDALVPERSREAHRAFMCEYMKTPVPRPMAEEREVFAMCGDDTEKRVVIALAPAPEGTVVAALIVARGPDHALNPIGH